MHAEVISIGDEVISGQILDTNVQWLSQQLEELGIRVLYHSGVGDELEPLVETFSRAIARAEVVVATGGLGPTADDLTREALANAVGRRLVRDAEALRQIQQLFARRKREMPARNELQAMFPEGSRIVRNPNGTAPGIDLDAPRPDGATSRVIALPGVPAEMKEMWHDSVEELLRRMRPGGRLIRHTRVKCFGAGESQIEARLPDGFLRQTDPVVGINASQTTIIFRIAAAGADEAECRRKTQPVVAAIRQRLGDLVFGEGDDELEDVVVRLLQSRKQTIAVAEWGTAGTVAERLGSVAGGETAFCGGVVVASPGALRAALGLEAGEATAADRAATEATAVACRKRFGTDYALAVSRFPPLAAADETPRPFYLAAAGPAGVTVKELPYAGHPAMLRVWCCKQALNLVRLTLLAAARLGGPS
jgi:nicotinamide-nucleotide amidase